MILVGTIFYHQNCLGERLTTIKALSYYDKLFYDTRYICDRTLPCLGKPCYDIRCLPTMSQCHTMSMLPTYSNFYQNPLKRRLVIVVIRHYPIMVSLTMTLDAFLVRHYLVLVSRTMALDVFPIFSHTKPMPFHINIIPHSLEISSKVVKGYFGKNGFSYKFPTTLVNY